MEQLTLRAEQTRGRMMELFMLHKKITIKLTREELSTLGRIMGYCLANEPIMWIEEKAAYFMIYQMFETMIRRRMMQVKQNYKISLNIAQVWAFEYMLLDLDLSQHPYEANIQRLILAEIHHQTV